jgi:hypothetical protein
LLTFSEFKLTFKFNPVVGNFYRCANGDIVRVTALTRTMGDDDATGSIDEYPILADFVAFGPKGGSPAWVNRHQSFSADGRFNSTGDAEKDGSRIVADLGPARPADSFETIITDLMRVIGADLSGGVIGCLNNTPASAREPIGLIDATDEQLAASLNVMGVNDGVTFCAEGAFEVQSPQPPRGLSIVGVRAEIARRAAAKRVAQIKAADEARVRANKEVITLAELRGLKHRLEFRRGPNREWMPAATPCPEDPDFEYRMKPTAVRWIAAAAHRDGEQVLMGDLRIDRDQASLTSAKRTHLVRLELDVETLAVVSARTEVA